MQGKITTTGLDATWAKLRGLSQGKINTAMVSAINQGARAGYEAAEQEVKRVFDRPTPWIQKAARYRKASSSKPEATVDFDYWGNKQLVTADKVLNAEIFGGPRKLKRFETALQRIGILPAGMAVVPGAGAKMDSYGNMQAGQINQILAWFRAFGQQGYKANMTDKGRARLARGSKRTGRRGTEYFVQKTQGKGLRPGIYQRQQFAFGSAVKPVMIFITIPTYRPRFDFYRVTTRAALDQMSLAFPTFLNQMLRERGL